MILLTGKQPERCLKKNAHSLNCYFDKTLALLSLDEANLFASHLRSCFTTQPNIIDQGHIAQVNLILINTLFMCLPTKRTSSFEVLHVVKKNSY